MSDFDEARKAFDARLRAGQAARQPQLEADLRLVREMFSRQVLPALPADIVARVKQFDSTAPAAARMGAESETRRPVLALVNMRRDKSLRQIDQDFAEKFELRRYLPGANLDYPTVYAETLEEFFGPFLDDWNRSPEARAAMLGFLTDEARRDAEESDGGSGTFGVNFPGRGCYINGWLYAYGKPYAKQPRMALADAAVFPRILSTIAHEKLGHGLITELTPLGEENKRLGLAQLDLAQRFNLHVVDSPAEALLKEKNDLVFQASHLTEEGWATWVQHTLLPGYNDLPEPPHTLGAVWQAIDRLADFGADAREAADALQRALSELFIKPTDQPKAVHAAIRTIQQIGLKLDDYFSHEIRQPLRYAVGYLLIDKLAANTGWQTAPYAVLIAANLTYDLEHIGVSDLRHLVYTNPLMNIDSRLALLATLKVPAPGGVAGLAQAAHSRLSLSVPARLRV